MSTLIGGLPRPPVFDSEGNFTPAWAGWFSQAQQLLSDAGNSGTTAQRPTAGLYVGKPYFDTSLGIPIWMKTPASAVWVNGAGTVV